jgi:hypothetical protein
LENNNPDTFFITKIGGNIMEERFKISTVIENGCLHYKIFDCKTFKEVHCDIGELNSTLYELMGE